MRGRAAIRCSSPRPGGGKTLAGFLPSLVDLTERSVKPQAGIHALYVSPLKALAVDIARNLVLGDDLDAWLAESSLMKRSFRVCATISGLIERSRHPGQEKPGRQMTVSSDLIYHVLRQHEPDHILLQAAFAEAATGLIDFGRLSGFLQRIRGRIRHIPLSRVLPLAVPVMLEIGRESVPGDASEALLREAVEELIAEAMGYDAALKV